MSSLLCYYLFRRHGMRRLAIEDGIQLPRSQTKPRAGSWKRQLE